MSISTKKGQSQNKKEATVVSQQPGEALNNLIDKGIISLSVGARACFNTNKLDWQESKILAQEIQAVDPSFVIPEHGNWFALNVLDHYGSEEVVSFSEVAGGVINKYKELTDNEGFGTYGVVSVEIDFSKLIDDKKFLENGIYGAIFTGDSTNPPDKAFGCVKLTKHSTFRLNNNRSYIRPVAGTKDKFTCVFRNRGTILIYAVTGEVEKRENVFWPIMKTIQIPVSVRRNRETGEFIGVNVGYRINVKTTVVEDKIRQIIAPIAWAINFYNLDINLVKQVLYTMGANPRDYIQTKEIGGNRRFGNHRRNRGVNNSYKEAVEKTEDEAAVEEENDREESFENTIIENDFYEDDDTVEEDNDTVEETGTV